MFYTTRWPTSGRTRAAVTNVMTHLLLGGTQTDARALSPIAALQELGHFCEATVHGAPAREGNLNALVADVRSALDGMGSSLQNRVSALASDLEQLLQAGSNLRDPAWARKVQLSRVDLETECLRPESVAAAWEDLRRACAREGSSTHRAAVLTKVLRDLVEARGREWDGPHGLVRNVLLPALDGTSDEALEPRPDKDNPETIGELEERRFDLCVARLRDERQKTNVVVWFVLRDAALVKELDLGPIRLVDVSHVRRLLERTETPEVAAEYPELASDDAPDIFLGVTGVTRQAGGNKEDARSHVEPAVLARVALDEATPDRAERQAAEALTSLLDIARTGPGWTVQQTSAAWFNRMWRSEGLRFDAPQALSRGSEHPAFSGTPDRLGAFDAEFISRFLNEDEGVVDAIADARWVVAAEQASDSAQRVGLGVRALERAFAPVVHQGTNWAEAAKRYLIGAWLDFQLRNYLRAAIVALEFGMCKTQDAQRYKSVHGFTTAQTAPRYTPDAVALFVTHGTHPDEEFGTPVPLTLTDQARNLLALETDVAPLKTLIDERLTEHQLVAEARRTFGTSVKAVQWLGEGEELFDTLLARLQRGRNAVLHGQKQSLGSLVSVQGFVGDLGRLVAIDRMATARDRREPLSTLQSSRTRHLSRKLALDASGDVVGALFGALQD